ncbi:hypothetical protein BU14_0014s0053 [Porphyra umbilicalis]|uniref:Uncharacterized protein n=1 Tax=Porphyra umbilicalis TaxID=2786 RepID=A0A1X6PLG0_PORUM|nr:hypothetical protein BU14_0014s0053 [Porphyra umbilicalis]|eukprot:OSX81503.1 hypothetical protein BU14_0014s0053 [Porphyra umbilicalis]
MGLPAMQDGMCQRARLDGGSEREGDGGPTSNDRLLIRYSTVFGDPIARRARPTPRAAGEKRHVPRRQCRDGHRVATRLGPFPFIEEKEDGHAQRKPNPTRGPQPGRGEALGGGRAPLVDGRVDGVGAAEQPVPRTKVGGEHRPGEPADAPGGRRGRRHGGKGDGQRERPRGHGDRRPPQGGTAAGARHGGGGSGKRGGGRGGGGGGARRGPRHAKDGGAAAAPRAGDPTRTRGDGAASPRARRADRAAAADRGGSRGWGWHWRVQAGDWGGRASLDEADEQTAEQNCLFGNRQTNAYLLVRLFGQQSPNRTSFCSASLLASLERGP